MDTSQALPPPGTATDWTVPQEPGPVIVWAVVHDNRGGVAWVQRRIVID